jgi:hypothetical protein
MDGVVARWSPTPRADDDDGDGGSSERRLRASMRSCSSMADEGDAGDSMKDTLEGESVDMWL